MRTMGSVESWSVCALVALGAAAAEGCTAKDATGCQAAAKASAADKYAPRIDPADFVQTVDNRYFPLVPGTSFKYLDDEEQIEVTVTAETRTVMGVKCVVVHDVARTPAGETLEDTYDWYAQDKAGSVWYFGEDTKAYQKGKVVSTLGSWESGKDCAMPGIVMKGQPQVGDKYRQEYLAGVAEDRAEVLSLDEEVTVPFGSFKNCLKTKDHSDLEPGKAEHKYYCPGVGQVLATEVVAVGTGSREELVSITKK